VKTEIEEQFDVGSTQFAAIRDRFASQVVRWVFSSAEIWSYEDRRWKGTDADILPDAKGALHACGFNAADQPVVLHHFDTDTVYEKTASGEYVSKHVPLTQTWAEEFVTHKDNILEVLRFVRGKLDSLARMRFEGHRLLEEQAVVQGFYQHTLIEYEGTKRKLQQSISREGRVFYEITYGPHGEQNYYRVRRDGTRFHLFQPLPKGITAKSLKETVRNRLLAIVPPLVAAAAITEPIYCVALVYDDEGNDALPPTVGIGVESERLCWKETHGKRAKEFAWNPAEFQHYEKPYTQLQDEALEEACDYLNGKWAEAAATTPAAKLLIEAAAELHRARWPASVRRTEDFVVFAVGVEGSGLIKSLKASLTAEKLAALKQAGWV
jgi:hypothetical protein